jgi:hypothetical protein
MANTINLISKYIPLLDEKYKRSILTNDLIGNMTLVREAMDAKSILIPKISTQALANYSRSAGFVAGDADLTWQTHTFTQDRGREFNIDNADNMETAGVAFGALAADFIQQRVAPEVDAYRFAKLFALKGAGAAADLAASTVDAAITKATEVLDDKNVPEEGRIIYVSAEIYKLLKDSPKYDSLVAPGGDKKIEMYDNMKLVRVPRTRFYTQITLRDGTTAGQEAGGFVKTASTGRDLNFVVVHPSAVLSPVKINAPRIFAPEINQDADAYKFQLRLYHDCFVFDNKVDGIYAHNKTT